MAGDDVLQNQWVKLPKLERESVDAKLEEFHERS